MDLLRLIDARISRWLAYADSCMNAQEDLARCGGFWTFVAVLLGIVCVATLVAVVARLVIERRRGAPQGQARYRKPS